MGHGQQSKIAALGCVSPMPRIIQMYTAGLGFRFRFTV